MFCEVKNFYRLIFVNDLHVISRIYDKIYFAIGLKKKEILLYLGSKKSETIDMNISERKHFFPSFNFREPAFLRI